MASVSSRSRLISFDMEANNLIEIIGASIRRVLREEDIMSYFDIDNIPEGELRKQYIDFSILLGNRGYGGRFSTIRGEIISEDIQATLSIEETKEEISKKFHLRNWQFFVDDSEDIKLIVLFPGIFQNSKKIIRAMEACGWYASTKSFKWVHNMLWRCISFDPRYLDSVKNDIMKYQYLYHWTPAYNLESILKDGLLPKSQNSAFDYPARIHFLPGNLPLAEVLNLGKQLCRSNKDNKNNGDYVLLRVYIGNSPENIDFFPDPRYSGGYYTESPISPSLIRIVMRENFRER